MAFSFAFSNLLLRITRLESMIQQMERRIKILEEQTNDSGIVGIR